MNKWLVQDVREGRAHEELVPFRCFLNSGQPKKTRGVEPAEFWVLEAEEIWGDYSMADSEEMAWGQSKVGA